MTASDGLSAGMNAGDRLREFPCDLHIHTALSPCGMKEMRPRAIAARARELGLALIAITDHNTDGNAAACRTAATEAGIACLAGMEVQTREEVHIVCLFADPVALAPWAAAVAAHLPQLTNPDARFGQQLLCDTADQVVGVDSRLLLTSTDLSVEEVFAGVADLGGICLPAHIDRPSFSLLGNLGLIPTGLDCPAVELSRRADPVAVRQRFPDTAGRTFVISSDAHWLEAMQPARTHLVACEPTFAELRLALNGRAGRRMVLVPEAAASQHCS